MNKIMELADEYARFSRDCMGYPQLPKSSRVELAAEVQAHISYTRAVIAERDDLQSKLQEAEAELAAMKQQKPVASFDKKRNNLFWCDLSRIKYPHGACCSEAIPDRFEKLYASPGAQPVPAGMQLVPVEPTPEMLTAATRASLQHLIDCVQDPKKSAELGADKTMKTTYAARYKAMLAADRIAKGKS